MALAELAAELEQARCACSGALDALGHGAQVEHVGQVEHRAQDRRLRLRARRSRPRTASRSSGCRAAAAAGSEATSGPSRSRRRRSRSRASFSSPSRRAAASRSSISAVSVISSVSPSGSSWAVSSASATCRTSSGAAELGRRDVHADLDPAEAPGSGAPERALVARGGQHPAAEVVDAAAALGERDEAVGRDQSARGMVPADQRLQARDRAGPEAEDRLVEERRARRARSRPSARPRARAAR